MSQEREWTVYLSGEIHTDWRTDLIKACDGLPVTFSAPVTVHEDSDDCGAAILGEPGHPFFRDQLGSGVNAIRTRTLISEADIVVIRFGDKYRQWNAAFDAGFAAALGTPIITQRPAELTHAMKEVDGAALATCETVEQVARILRYVITGELQR